MFASQDECVFPHGVKAGSYSLNDYCMLKVCSGAYNLRLPLVHTELVSYLKNEIFHLLC